MIPGTEANDGTPQTAAAKIKVSVFEDLEIKFSFCWLIHGKIKYGLSTIAVGMTQIPKKRVLILERK
jgi:hypothetical protein